MTHFRTCRTCAKPPETCERRAELKAKLRGLGVTSLKHRCDGFEPAFVAGDAVRVNTLAWFAKGEESPPPRLDFPGHFVSFVGGKALVFVPAKAEDMNGEGVEFEPSGNGYLKVPLSRLSPRDAPAADIKQCRWCGAMPALDSGCGYDPHYTPSGYCLKATREAEEAAADEAAERAYEARREMDREPDNFGEPW